MKGRKLILFGMMLSIVTHTVYADTISELLKGYGSPSTYSNESISNNETEEGQSKNVEENITFETPTSNERIEKNQKLYYVQKGQVVDTGLNLHSKELTTEDNWVVKNLADKYIEQNEKYLLLIDGQLIIYNGNQTYTIDSLNKLFEGIVEFRLEEEG